jgi:osmotically-inducible protein OsmY
MEITVDGDTVKVSGDAVSQEMKDKIILAVGNVKGVSAV